MVVELEDPEEIDRIFHALADATRRDIVHLVLQGEHSVSELARRYPMSFAAVQKHVVVLERAHLVRKERRGREQIVTGDLDAIRRAQRLLDEYEAVWRGRMDRFAAVLAEADLLDDDIDTQDQTDRRTDRDTHAGKEPRA